MAKKYVKPDIYPFDEVFGITVKKSSPGGGYHHEYPNDLDRQRRKEVYDMFLRKKRERDFLRKKLGLV